MKTIFYTIIILFIFSCNSGHDTNNSSDSAQTTTVKGNSAGSSTIEMDTMHMDTASHTATRGSAH